MSSKLNQEVKGGIFSIRTRIALFVAVPLLVLIATIFMGYYLLQNTSNQLTKMNDATEKGRQIAELIHSLDVNITDTLYSASLATMEGTNSSAASALISIGLEKFDNDWNETMQNDIVSDQARFSQIQEYKSTLSAELLTIKQSIEQVRVNAAEEAVNYDVATVTTPLKLSLQNEIAIDRDINAQSYQEAVADINFSTKAVGITVLSGLFLTLLGAILFNRSIYRPLNHLSQVISELSQGNTTARSNLVGSDELTQLGDAFNNMMDEQETLQSQVDEDNESINNSVFALLDAVSDLSERDLTVRAEVTEDATGPLADAINQLAEDTTEVLEEVRSIAISVEQTSASVNERSQEVNKLATEEQKVAEETATQIERIRRRLETIAQSAMETNTIAASASGATQEAYDSVSRSMNSIGDIRTTVQDTGKRIKRLGERSQEISYITDIINGIAERTTVLALNANMQAMAAGDAGQGFSVIADEIQRLAESSQESTEQITELVKNIQQETTSTMATMDHAIEQVIEGANLADEATNQMQQTLDSTNKLTTSVNDIANASKEQMEMSDTLQARATRIMETTTATGQEMSLLAQLTGDMSQFAKQLVESVNVFKLKS